LLSIVIRVARMAAERGLFVAAILILLINSFALFFQCA